jgi:hypothetical protein
VGIHVATLFCAHNYSIRQEGRSGMAEQQPSLGKTPSWQNHMTKRIRWIALLITPVQQKLEIFATVYTTSTRKPTPCNLLALDAFSQNQRGPISVSIVSGILQVVALLRSGNFGIMATLVNVTTISLPSYK